MTAASIWGPGVDGTRKEPCPIRETERHGEANHDARGGRAVRMPSGKIVTARPAVRVEASVISLISIRIRVEDNPWGN